MSKITRLAAAVLLSLLSSSQVFAAEKIFEITARKFEFEVSPVPEIVVNKGDTVTLKVTALGAESTTHGFILPPFVPETTLLPGVTNTFTFVANQEGTFEYFCTVPTCGEGHTDMTGDMLVEAADDTPPFIASVQPGVGPESGGTAVEIAGDDFQTGATVQFGGVTATGVVVVDNGEIQAVTPPHPAGPVEVRVANPGGGVGTLSNGFLYIAGPRVSSVSPGSGPAIGGTAVTVKGSDFVAGASATFGGAAATNVLVTDAATITAVTPAHAAGPVSVTVKNPDEQTGTLANAFTFIGPPTLSSITPSRGATTGGTPIKVTGTGFVSGASVIIGGASSSQVLVTGSTVIDAVSPAHAAGTADVVVQNPDTQTATLPGAFTFIAFGVLGISPVSGPPAGSTFFSLQGAGFVPGVVVLFGEDRATNIQILSPTTLTGLTPAHAAGAVDVSVVREDGTRETLTRGFTYLSSGQRRRAVKR